jgi:hypothetical protein
MMDNDDVAFAEGVFDRLGKAGLKPTGHVRLTREYEQVFPGLLCTCRQAESQDNQTQQMSERVRLTDVIGHPMCSRANVDKRECTGSGSQGLCTSKFDLFERNNCDMSERLVPLRG